jgi:peptide deformylase
VSYDIEQNVVLVLKMALLKIARMGHPVLRRRSEVVADPTTPEIARIIEDMAQTMVDAPGVGLAAPQVHVPLRIILFYVPRVRAVDSTAPEGSLLGPVPLTALINPTIVPLVDEFEDGWEGCLSVPGLGGVVPRFQSIRYSGLAPDGRLIEREATGFHARVVQHECDHLDGILYPQRMRDLRTLGFVDEMQSASTLVNEAATDTDREE